MSASVAPWPITPPPTDDDAPPDINARANVGNTSSASRSNALETGSSGRPELRDPYRLIPLSALPEQPVKPEDVLWGDILLRGATTVFAGQPGVGKTTLARGIAAAIATGNEYCGFHGPPGGAPVVYLDYETAGAYRAPRWKRVCGDDLSSIDTLFVNNAFPVFDPEVVAADVIARGAALVVVDTLARATCAMDLDENVNSDMSRVMDGFDVVAREANCAVLVVTHQSKGRHDGYRGASAIGASAAVVVTLGRADSDKGTDADSAVYILNVEKNRLGGDGPIRLMRDGDGGFALAPDSDGSVETSRAESAILDVLADAGGPVARKDLLSRVAARLSGAGKAPSERTIERALDALNDRGRVRRPERGFYEARATKPSA